MAEGVSPQESGESSAAEEETEVHAENLQAAEGEAEVYKASAADGSDDEDSDDGADAAGDAQLQEAIARIRADKDLPQPPLPTPPSLALHAKPADKLRAVQAYIERLQYNYTGTDYFDVRKNRPYARVLETARLIVKTALPIKCVEAVFVALLLTQELTELDRVPLAFKSRIDGRVAKHIVLAVRMPGVGWGALGLSRRKALYYKELGSCASLSDLYADFLRSYESVCHRLVRVRVGLPVPHDSFSTERVCWAYRSIAVRTGEEAHADVCSQLNAFARSANKLAHAWRTGGANGPSATPAAAANGAGAVQGLGGGVDPAAAVVSSPARRQSTGTAGAAARHAGPVKPVESPKRAAVASAPKRAASPKRVAGGSGVAGAVGHSSSPKRAAAPSPKRAAPHLRV